MDVHELATVWNNPNLLRSFGEYAAAQQWSKAATRESSVEDQLSRDVEAQETSILLLRVEAAADYYSDIENLMLNPPPVLVDLILDPFILNVLPRSLLPTGLYIVAVSIITWFVAAFVRSQLKAFVENTDDDDKKKK